MSILDNYARSTEDTAIRADLNDTTDMWAFGSAKVSLYVEGNRHHFLSVEQASILAAQLTNAIAEATVINEKASGRIRTLTNV